MKFGRCRTTILLIAITLLGGTLMGCGEVKEETQVNLNKAAEKIEFSWWGNDPRHIYTMEGVDLFMEQNPEIDVDYRYGIWNGFETRNKVYMNSHTEPDVMQINFNWLDIYSADGNGYYDLYELSDIIDLSVFSKDDLQFGEIDGKLNALPIAYNSPVIFYNRDIYAKYGLSVPETWDDLFAAAEVMREDGVYPLGAVKKHLFMLLAAYYEQTTGEPVYSENGTFLPDREGVVTMLSFYRRLVDEKVIVPVDQFDRGLLGTGELAGAMFWISDISNYCSSIEESGTPELGKYLKVSADQPLSGWYRKPATMYAISRNTEHPEASARLLNFLLNDPQMAILQGTEKGIPVSASALAAIEEEGLLTGYSVDANDQMLQAGGDLKILVPAMEDEARIENFKAGADEYLFDKTTLQAAADAIWASMQ